MAPSSSTGQPQPWDYSLRKYLLLLASVVATVTYGVGFSPPGGTWPESADGHHPGDPIIRDAHYLWYSVFYYCNATAFGSSLLVVVLILLLAMLHERKGKKLTIATMMPLRGVMVLDLLSLMVAYAAGTCRDKLTVIYTSVMVAAVVVYLIYQVLMTAWWLTSESDPEPDDMLLTERNRKVVMLLATFAVSVTYVAGLSTPGGFWDSDEKGVHNAGDAVLNDHHEARLKVFFVCNTTSFVTSLLIIVVLLGKTLHEKTMQSDKLYGCIIVSLVGLVGAYAAGSSRKIHTTIYVVCLVVAVLVCIRLLVLVVKSLSHRAGSSSSSSSSRLAVAGDQEERRSSSRQQHELVHVQAADKARSLVLLLATLAATITYQAGLQPPGGLWQNDRDDGDNSYMVGDPILQTTNPKRYKAFYYCNSVAFVASLVAIVLIQQKLLLKNHVLEAAMILDLFGLIGAYAIGTCRDANSSIYVMAMAGAVLVYVVIHVIFFTLDHKKDDANDELVEKRRKRLLLFAIMAATITYQAGLTPPGGFLSNDDNSKPSGSRNRAGDPVLLHNDPRRYMVFFYCNSVSFMLSMALIMLLVNPNMYRPAIRSYALSVCTAAGLFALIGAYAAGSTQHLRTTISIIVLMAVVFMILVLLFVVFLVNESPKDKESSTQKSDPGKSTPSGRAQPEEEMASVDAQTQQVKQDEKMQKKRHGKRKYLMLLGILVANVTYQAGVQPPGGLWQQTDGKHEAGNPVMGDNRKLRYDTFFYSNSTSLVASIVVIILLLPHKRLLPQKLQEEDWWFRVMNSAIVLDLLALLLAYATGSSRKRKTTVRVAALVIAVLGYFVIHLLVSYRFSKKDDNNQAVLPAALGNGSASSSVTPVTDA